MTRIKLLARLLFFALFLPGCDLVQAEFHSPDGFAGPEMNRRLPAVTPLQRADRYLLGLALLGPVTLETSAVGTDTRNTISLINSSYDAMTDLYEAVAKCSSAPLNCKLDDEPHSSVYAFETISYDIQKRFYRLAKTLVLNLDLDESVSDIMDLNPSGLLSLARRAADTFPAARRGAATYRDAIFIYASGVNTNCAGSDKCGELNTALQNLYSTGTAYSSESGERRLRRILRLAQEAARERTTAWDLGPDRRRALVYHLDKACDVAFDTQTVGDDPAGQKDSCGKKADATSKSDSRQSLLNQIAKG